MLTCYLFNGIKCSSTPWELFPVQISDIVLPWPQNYIGAYWPESKESEVAVRHVAVLGVEQKLIHDREVRVTVHDNCVTHSKSGTQQEQCLKFARI